MYKINKGFELNIEKGKNTAPYLFEAGGNYP